MELGPNDRGREREQSATARELNEYKERFVKINKELI